MTRNLSGLQLETLTLAIIASVLASQLVLIPSAAAEQTNRLIHEIQGSGESVAISDEVMVQGIVTSLFERRDALDGFFVQEEDVDADADPATSEGIFVFCRNKCPADLATGDQVTVSGSASDRFGMSQINALSGSGGVWIDSTGNALPTAALVNLPAASSTLAESTFENVEGMLVTFPDTLVVSEYFALARYGHIVLTETSRPNQFTHENPPSVDGYVAYLEELENRRIFLDDDNNDQNDAISGNEDEAYYYPEGGLSLGNKFRGGDSITELTGVMHWSWAGSNGTDAWRIRPVPSAFDYHFDVNNPPPAVPSDVGGSLRVASFNVLNYFTTIDTTSNNSSSLCGPSASLDCRGADSNAELMRQRDKIVAAMTALDADVFGLIELENDDDASIADLVDALNAASGKFYDYVPTGFIGTDAIKVGFIYDSRSLTLLGDFALLDSQVDATFLDNKNRPVLIQSFIENGTSERFTLALNHLKSKGSPCDDVGDPDQSDGQANCPATRTAAMNALINYLSTDPTDSDDPDFLIMGDLNAYAMEDPVSALLNVGYTDLLARFAGSSAYSYVFDGQLGYLDHALANSSMLSQVNGTTAWHINSDEVDIFDYNDDIEDDAEAFFERESGVMPVYRLDAFRSSDHDPVLIGMTLDSIPDYPTCNGLPATIIGTPGDDMITGTRQRDVIVGFGGDDTIVGGNEQDVICGGFGDDTLKGGNGTDMIFGEAGDDTLTGNRGKDTLDGGEGIDKGDGGRGKDACIGIEVTVSCEI